jgi:hypothetical protein
MAVGAGAGADCAAATCGKAGDWAGAFSVAPADSVNGREGLSSAETRFEANRALKANAFSASATGSRGGSVAMAGCGNWTGCAAPPGSEGFIVAAAPAGNAAKPARCAAACCSLWRWSALKSCSSS